MRVDPPFSKSRFLAGLQCPKRLYLQVHQPGLIATPDDPAGRARAAVGDDIRRLAQTRHPGGVHIGEDARHPDAAVEATARAMEDPSVPAVFDAAFHFEGIRVRVDIVSRNEDGTWDLQDVKSSTKVKVTHGAAMALQAYVVAGSGVPVGRVGVLHLDGDYVLDDVGLDVAQLFRFVELSPTLRDDVGPDVAEMRAVLARGDVPQVDPGAHCHGPFECPLTSRCVPPPGPYDLRQVPQGGRLHALAAELGIDDVRLLPPNLRLKPLQRRVVDCVVGGVEHVGPGLRAAIEAVEHPVGFLDFETFMPAVPRYVGTGVYQALPTQWSLHVLGADGALRHAEFIHDEDTDPRVPFAESLLGALEDVGSVMVYSSYEAVQVRALAACLPTYGAALLGLLDRFVDLLAVVREHYYHPAFKGSYSIKRVLPALAADLSYDDLAIHDGNTAALMYLRMLDPGTAAEERRDLREALLRYCERDTLAMVRVREELLARCAGVEATTKTRRGVR